MDAQLRSVTKKVIPFFAAGLFVFLLYLYFLVPFADLAKIFETINLFYFFLALCALLISAVFYSLTWQCLLNMLSEKTSFLKAFQFVWVANFVDILVPAESVSGDASRIFLMSREPGKDAGKVVASVLSHRVLATCVTVASLIFTTIFFLVNYKPPPMILELIVTIAALSVIFIGLSFYLSMKEEVTKKIVNGSISLLIRISRGRWKFESLRESAMIGLGSFHEGIASLRRNREGLVLAVILSAIAWLLEVVIAVLVFFSLGPLETTISLSAIVIVYSVSIVVHYIPLISGELGIVEIVMTSLFTLLGNPESIAVFAVATVLIRVLTLWCRLFVGGLTVQLMGLKGLIFAKKNVLQTAG